MDRLAFERHRLAKGRAGLGRQLVFETGVEGEVAGVDNELAHATFSCLEKDWRYPLQPKVPEARNIPPPGIPIRPASCVNKKNRKCHFAALPVPGRGSFGPQRGQQIFLHQLLARYSRTLNRNSEAKSIACRPRRAAYHDRMPDLLKQRQRRSTAWSNGLVHKPRQPKPALAAEWPCAINCSPRSPASTTATIWRCRRTGDCLPGPDCRRRLTQDPLRHLEIDALDILLQVGFTHAGYTVPFCGLPRCGIRQRAAGWTVAPLLKKFARP